MNGSTNDELSAAPRSSVAPVIARRVDGAGRRRVRRLCHPTHAHATATAPTAAQSAHQ